LRNIKRSFLRTRSIRNYRFHPTTDVFFSA